MAVFDCFTYFNEEEILQIRLEELKHYVNNFVVVEATQTFTGKDKPLYFDDIGPWIGEYLPKIIRIVVDFPEENMTSWEREAYQRDQIIRGLYNAAPNDTIIISDADEIPRPQAIQCGKDNPVQLDVKQYFWNYHWQVPDHCNQGARPVVAYKEDITTPQEMRASAYKRVPYGGWHFSFFGDGAKARHKIEAFAHTEMDRTAFKRERHILYCIENGIDPFDRFPLKWTAIDETYPIAVQKRV